MSAIEAGVHLEGFMLRHLQEVVAIAGVDAKHVNIPPNFNPFQRRDLSQTVALTIYPPKLRYSLQYLRNCIIILPLLTVM